MPLAASCKARRRLRITGTKSYHITLKYISIKQAVTLSLSTR